MTDVKRLGNVPDCDDAYSSIALVPSVADLSPSAEPGCAAMLLAPCSLPSSGECRSSVVGYSFVSSQ